MERAVAKGTRLVDVIKLAGEIRAARPAAGIVIFGYLNPILRHGLSRLLTRLRRRRGRCVGDGLIVEEAGPYLAEMSGWGWRRFFWPRQRARMSGSRRLRE